MHLNTILEESVDGCLTHSVLEKVMDDGSDFRLFDLVSLTLSKSLNQRFPAIASAVAWSASSN